ncbi:MAG TPA: adenosylmethionine--8-amino-7-oxononanoate transaminase [Caulobacteraceae bacterium]|nr:adenosylmethionine--8-amino-7-oxononanoate transaminase [Caulobacteraceae bacterium]
MSEQNTPSWFRTGRSAVWPPYARFDAEALPVARAAGVRLTLADGRQLIDGVANWWTACHGHSHPHLVQAMTGQLQQFSHVMFAGLAHESAYRLAERLTALVPGDFTRVFFSESGSVSVEVALKMAAQYWMICGRPGKTRFVAFRGGYHGDTLGTMPLCDPEEGMHAMYAGVFSPALLADLPNDPGRQAALDRLLADHADEIAAVIVEPLVQGAGGMRMDQPATLTVLRELCDRHGVLLIFDEIFTGFGRTGSMFAFEQAGAAPDILCLSKALSGGMAPLAATLARRPIAQAFERDHPAAVLMHGPTFMAGALACAAANASLDLFEREPRLEQALAIEAQLKAQLELCRALPGVVDVRVKGAIGAVELDQETDGLRHAFPERGVWVRPFGRIVYLTPPLIIGPQDLARLTEAVVDVVSQWSRSRL